MWWSTTSIRQLPRPPPPISPSAGARSLACAGDVARKESEVVSLIDAAMGEFGQMEVLVSNAMKIVPGKLGELSEEAWDTTMNIGLLAARSFEPGGRPAT